MNETLSVIVTCHNLEKYIGEAIESILKQDYQGPVEIVVVDDASSDRSAEIIKSYPNVRHLHSEKNLGVLMATVYGIENSTGEWVCFLDGDDIWEPNKLSEIASEFNKSPQMALITHNLHYIDSNGKLINRLSRPDVVMSAALPADYDSLIRDGILLHGDYVWLGSAYAVHRTRGNLHDFCQFAKTLPDSFNTYQDWPLAFWVACQKFVTMGYIPLKLFCYRLHGANYSGDATSVNKVLRNVGRTLNTLLAIQTMAIQFDANNKILNTTNAKLAFYRYLVNLYSGHRWLATKGALASLPYWCANIAAFRKELTRFIGVQLLGPAGFINFTASLKKLVH